MSGVRDTLDLSGFVEATWLQNKPDYVRAHTSIKDFEAIDVLDYVPFEVAADAIRQHLKTYVEMTSRGRLAFEVVRPDKWLVSTTSKTLEDAIAASRSILEIQVNPDEGVTTPYSEETWQRAIKLLREMSDLFWQAASEPLPAPAIGPATDGSLDLFWELVDLTLLINVTADQSKHVTFFGRRLRNSKISGVLDQDDAQPRHLTGWLLGRD